MRSAARKVSMVKASIAWTLVAAWIFIAVGAGAQDKKLERLRVGGGSASTTQMSMWFAKEGNFYEKQGLNVEGSAYREQMKAALPFLISAAVPAEIAKLVTNPVQAFLAGGQRLDAVAEPPTPLGVMDLVGAAEDPMTLPDMLHLTLKSEAPAQ